MGVSLVNSYFSRINFFSAPCRQFLGSRFSVLYTNRKGLKQSIEEKLNLPLKPKKPLSPFFRFMMQIRPSIVEQHPTISVTDVSKKISQQWHALDPKTRSDLETQYQKEKEVYGVAKLKYSNSLTIEQKEALEQEKLKNLEIKTKRKLKKKAKENEKPKKPPSSYVLFVISRANSRGNTPITEWHKQLGNEWRNLPESQKNKFVEEAKSLVEKYRKEVALWEEKMISLGNVDLVRTGALLPKTKSKK